METKTNNEPKLTEWDSSKATLMRIDKIISLLHECKIGNTSLFPTDAKLVHLNTLERLYVEGQSKFTHDEETKCNEYQKQITELKTKTKGHLFAPKVKSNNGDIQNKLYNLAWSEMNVLSRNYELYLMNCLDNHNMLMKDSKDGMTKFRGG